MTLSGFRNFVVQNIIGTAHKNVITRSAKNQRKQPTTAMERRWHKETDAKKSSVSNSERNVNTKQSIYTLLSYNILAQQLLLDNLQLYNDIDHKYLRWSHRMDLIEQEVFKLRPDILCLQEVEQANLKEIIKRFSSRDPSLKLEYVFKKRTGSRCDGCAVIYNRSKFKMTTHRCVEYYTSETSTSNRENVALLAKFIVIDEPATSFIAATTHLLYNPRRHDVRISQIKKLLSSITKFSQIPDSTLRCPVILTGDFNSLQDSAEFQQLTATRMKLDEEANEPEQFQMLPIDFGLYGASTFQNQWIIVDYILVSASNKNEKHIHINSTYELPDINTCRRFGKLPNKYNGSDHFSLAIQFSVV